MSPACPFITEHLYQNLKKLSAPHALDGSIHYQMLPQVNESLINVGIEEAVANMTSVIRLGRTIRDQKVRLPSKNNLLLKRFNKGSAREISPSRSRRHSPRASLVGPGRHARALHQGAAERAQGHFHHRQKGIWRRVACRAPDSSSWQATGQG